MENKNGNGVFEVLSPWAEADPVPSRGIATRIKDLEGKKVGFLRNSKRAARPTLTVLEDKLKARFPSLEISHFVFLPNDDVAATEDLPKFEQWLKEIDAVVLAYGD
jgi:hypothetical protein